MSVYNITGWSGGGRRPLTYNLRAGQFRNMGGCNVFGSPTRTVINNNFGGGFGYGYDCDCGCNDGGVPSWMQWMMGGGMVMNFLGQMMSAIFPAKESKEAKGADGKGGLTDAQKTDLAVYKSSYNKECTISGPLSNGTFIVVDKTGKAEQKRTTVLSFDDLVAHLETTYDKTAEEPEETGLEAQLKSAQKLIEDSDLDDIKAEIKDGKIVYKFGEDEFDTFAKAIEAKVKDKQEVKPNVVAAQQATVNQEVANTPTAYKPTANDKTWYELFSDKYVIPAGTSEQSIKLAACQLANLSTPKNAIKLNSNGTISTTTNKGPGSFASINLPPSITLNGVTYNLKS